MSENKLNQNVPENNEKAQKSVEEKIEKVDEKKILEPSSEVASNVGRSRCLIDVPYKGPVDCNGDPVELF